ncbi:hypothetical protein KIN20_015345 [Parelaphostrongylus tenuis]|uniref:Uncharacterized protein n=1 Tax=Parelaphostrongylus tenuis TaxID=148309 RepID=A0AAD5MJD8_PARTN|nr:hypothetical protein KIN20_015345 [Parelaphostrongylus tenuis]
MANSSSDESAHISANTCLSMTYVQNSNLLPSTLHMYDIDACSSSYGTYTQEPALHYSYDCSSVTSPAIDHMIFT